MPTRARSPCAWRPARSLPDPKARPAGMTDDAQKEVPPTERLTDIALDDSAVIRRSPEVEHERAVAIYDLLEDNFFRPLGDYSGPYHLRLSIAETRLQLDIRDEDGQRLDSVALPLLPFRRVIRDYFSVCESYYEAIKTASPARIEAIDMGRREIGRASGRGRGGQEGEMLGGGG